MLWLAGSIQLLSLIAPSIACTSGKGFTSTVSTILSDALACGEPAIVGETKLGGSAASACNQAQANYAALETAELAGLAARCACKEAYYDNAKTLSDVDLWTNCIGPVNILIVTSARLVRDYQLAHAQEIFATCNACTDAQFPPVDAALEQVQTVLDFALDWKGQLLDTEIGILKEGIKAVVVSAVVGQGVPNGAPSPSLNFIESTITKGSSSNTNSNSLRPRLTNNTSPAGQLIKDIIGVQVRLLMVPVNGSSTVLENQLKAVFTGSDFTSNITAWNANLTGSTYTAVRGLQSANATASTSTNQSASTTSGTPTSTKTGSASSLQPVTILLVLMLTFCFGQML